MSNPTTVHNRLSGFIYVMSKISGFIPSHLSNLYRPFYLFSPKSVFVAKVGKWLFFWGQWLVNDCLWLFGHMITYILCDSNHRVVDHVIHVVSKFVVYKWLSLVTRSHIFCVIPILDEWIHPFNSCFFPNLLCNYYVLLVSKCFNWWEKT